jgi:hypothetical protein
VANILSSGKSGNRLLDALSQSDFERLLPHIEATPMHFRQIFHKQGEQITHAYFPTGGVGSVTKVMSDGAMIEFLDTVRATGKTPAAVLRDEGVLGPDVLLAHAVYLAGHRASAYPHGGDLEILGASGASVVHAPAGFARRGISMESFDRYRAAGINMVMGTDVYPLDMLAEMRTAALACKLFEQNHESAPAMAIYNASNLGGARALGRDDLGRLAVGAKADIVMLDWDNLHIGPFTDPIRALIYQGSADMVHTVICDGRTLLEAKRLLVCDEREVLAGARHSASQVWAGFTGYHWAGHSVDEEFPPAIRAWPDA